MGTWSVAAKNSMLDSLTIAYISLHTGDPGATGVDNEVSGGSPAYARKAATINAAATGSRALDADVTLDVPACTVSYVGYWSLVTGGVFHGSDDVTDEVFGAQGQYKVLASGTTLAITD